MLSKITAFIKKWWIWGLVIALVFGVIRSWIKDQIQGNKINELENELLIQEQEQAQQQIQANIIEDLEGNPERVIKIIGGLTE